MLSALVKNGIFKEGVLDSINLHTLSLYERKPTPQKAKELVKNWVSYSCLKFGAQILYNCASARSWEKNSKCLKNLTLVACTIIIKSECSRGLLEVFHGKGDASADGNLGTNSTIVPKETQCEDVHRATLSLGHADLMPKNLANDARNGAPMEDCKGWYEYSGVRKMWPERGRRRWLW